MELGRLVAPMTTTEARFFIPSMRVRSWETMRRSTWWVRKGGREKGVGVGE